MLSVLPTPTAEASLYRVSRYSYPAPSAGAFAAGALAAEALPVAQGVCGCLSGICCDCDHESGKCRSCCDAAAHCCPDGKPGDGNTCANVLSDPANCGRCGHACPTGQTCSRGACVGTCPPGLTMCGNACVDTTHDFSNCGGCGTSCANQPGGPYNACCPGPDGRGQCMNLINNNNHCGACGNACPPGMFCYGTRCVCGGSGRQCQGGQCQNGTCVCPTGQTYCAATGQCADLSSDANNCGTCGNACPTGQTCSGGACCPPGQTYCAVNNQCADLSSDVNNCGWCGNLCITGSGEQCIGGQCVVPSPPPPPPNCTGWCGWYYTLCALPCAADSVAPFSEWFGDFSGCMCHCLSQNFESPGCCTPCGV